VRTGYLMQQTSPSSDEFLEFFRNIEFVNEFLERYTAGNTFFWNNENPEQSWFPEVFWEKIGCNSEGLYLTPIQKWEKALGLGQFEEFIDRLNNLRPDHQTTITFQVLLHGPIGDSIPWTIIAKPLTSLGNKCYTLCQVKRYNSLIDEDSDILQWINECNTVMTCHRLDGSYVWANKEYTKQFGFGEDKIKGKNPFESMHPKDLIKTQEALRTLKEEKTIKSFNNRIIKADGYFAHIKWSCNTINDKIYCILEDITDEVNADVDFQKKFKFIKILREITSKYLVPENENIDKAIDDSLSFLGKELGVDRTYIFEYEEQKDTVSNTFEWCNKHIEPQIHQLQNLPMTLFSEWKEAHMKNMVYVIPDVSQTKNENERRILGPQGIKSLIAIPLMEDDKYVGFIGVDSVQDFQAYSKEELEILKAYGKAIVALTLRKKLKERLQQNRRLREQIEEDIQIGTWEVDVKNNQTYWSRRTYDIHEVNESFSHNLQVGVDFFHPDDKPIIRKAIFNAIELHENYELELRLISAKNNEKTVKIKGSVIVENGEVSKIIGTIKDITPK